MDSYAFVSKSKNGIATALLSSFTDEIRHKREEIHTIATVNNEKAASLVEH